MTTRGIGAIDAIQGVLPSGAGDVLAVLTQLGDVWLLVVVLSLVYWFRDRESGAFAILTLLGALALVVGLKSAVAWPRPPPATRLVAVDGFGFPSGHAIAATVGWGALAITLDEPSPRVRYGVATAIVLLVAITRVGLGVHYAVDVLAGMAVGVGYLLMITALAGRDPLRAGGIAAIAALAGIGLSGGASDAVLLAGGVVGGLIVWREAGIPRQPWRKEGFIPAVIGGGIVGTALLVGYGGPIGLPVAFLLGLVAVGVVIGLPAAGLRVGIGR